MVAKTVVLNFVSEKEGESIHFVDDVDHRVDGCSDPLFDSPVEVDNPEVGNLVEDNVDMAVD